MSIREGKSSRILVADDEPSVLAALKMMLEFYQHSVVAVSSGEAALKELEKEPFDLILTDYAMHGINGMDLALRVKRDKPQQRILMITAYADMLTEECRAAVDAILCKPFMAQELKEVVDTLLESRRKV